MTDGEKKRLTHLDEAGQALMVNVGSKGDTERLAVARGAVVMEQATLDLMAGHQLAKGDVLATARIAGIMAAKKTPDLIPLCHPLMLTQVSVDFTLLPAEGVRPARIDIEAVARTVGKTGVEMEALTAVAVAALTIYDMGKAVDRAMRITDVRLVRKAGGKSGSLTLEE